jgi:chaperonin GroES
MAKLVPLADHVIITREEAESLTAGGIVLPDTAKEKPQRGKVLAVGPGKLLESGRRAELSLSEGDTVLFGRYSGTELELEGLKVTILREADILAVLHPGHSTTDAPPPKPKPKK